MFVPVCSCCNQILYFNSYFGLYQCPQCNDFFKTNEDKIRTMRHDELYNFLNTIAQDGPWYDEFDKAFCKNCEPTGYINGNEVCQCELTNKCPRANGDPLEWWLKQYVKV